MIIERGNFSTLTRLLCDELLTREKNKTGQYTWKKANGLRLKVSNAQSNYDEEVKMSLDKEIEEIKES